MKLVSDALMAPPETTADAFSLVCRYLFPSSSSVCANLYIHRSVAAVPHDWQIPH